MAEARAAGSSPPRVLLVEDDASIREVTRLLLERSGRFSVCGEAVDGAEGLAVAESLQPDIVLLDLVVPEIDGRSALPTLVLRCPRTMVVVVSGLDAADEEQGALAAGAFAYVEKRRLGVGFAALLEDLYAQFRTALSGSTVLAPSTLRVNG